MSHTIQELKQEYQRRLKEAEELKKQINELRQGLILQIGTKILDQYDFDSIEEFDEWFELTKTTVPEYFTKDLYGKPKDLKTKEIERTVKLPTPRPLPKPSNHTNQNLINIQSKQLSATSTNDESCAINPKQLAIAHDAHIRHIVQEISRNDRQRIIVSITRSKKHSPEYYVNPSDNLHNNSDSYLDMEWNTQKHEAKLLDLNAALIFYGNFKKENPDIPIQLHIISESKQHFFTQYKE